MMQNLPWLGLLVAVPALILLLVLGIGVLIQVKERLYIGALGVLLLGYMLTGKGVAYLGVAPLYISEIVFALGLISLLFLTLVRGRFYIGAINHWNAVILFLFILWCASRTVPYLSVYRLDALRDGVIWGYALIAFCVAILMTPAGLEKTFNAYGRWLPLILIWFVIARILAMFVPLPSLPGSPVSIITIKSGDMGAHLAGAGAFLLLRLDRIYGKPFSTKTIWLMWASWGIAWLLYGSTGRAGMLASLLGLALVVVLRPKLTGWVRPAILVTILLIALLLADLYELSQVNSAGRRVLSFQQITTNFTSIVGGPSRTDQEGTIQWRLAWWRVIMKYSFDLDGGYFLKGKGFGVNLANADGFQSPPGAPPNRHPHNITMNILARAGVPGFILWLLFLLHFGLRLLKATTRGGFAGKTAIWLLAYWLALVFNAQFDVFLEGPMGGIWFWALVGMTWIFVYRLPKWQGQSRPLPAPAYPALQHTPL
jgi:O-antigen ligase